MINTLEKLCAQYEKYIISLRLADTTYYLVWGSDSTDESKDKMLLDARQNILLFRSPIQAFHYIVATADSGFDSEVLVQWAQASLIQGWYACVHYDLEELSLLLSQDRLKIKIGVAKADLRYWVNFMNLVGDYAHQIQDEALLAIREMNAIASFWEFTYDTFFWTIPEPELANRQQESLREFHYASFQKEAQLLLACFRARLVVSVYNNPSASSQ